VLLRCAKYQQALRRYQECNVRSRELHVGDMVLRRVKCSKDEDHVWFEDQWMVTSLCDK
jgi:hypothetical protein